MANPSLASVLKEEVGRIVQQEVRRQMAGAAKASAQSQREITTLTRQIERLQRELSSLRGNEAPKQSGSKKAGTKKAASKKKTAPTTAASEKGNGKANGAAAADKKASRRRFSGESLKKHRESLGLSADNYGKLIGVSGLSIYNWESGKANPRESSIEALMQIKGLGKRAATKRLEEINSQVEEASGQKSASSNQEAPRQEAAES